MLYLVIFGVWFNLYAKHAQGMRREFSAPRRQAALEQPDPSRSVKVSQGESRYINATAPWSMTRKDTTVLDAKAEPPAVLPPIALAPAGSLPLNTLQATMSSDDATASSIFPRTDWTELGKAAEA